MSEYDLEAAKKLVEDRYEQLDGFNACETDSEVVFSLSSALDHITDLQAQLTATKRAADCMAALERLVPSSDFSSAEISYAHDYELEDDDEPPWTFTISGKDFQGPDLQSAIEAAESAKGEGE